MRQRRVAVIDSDIASFKAISRLGKAEGFDVVSLVSCDEFQKWLSSQARGGEGAPAICLVVDAASFALDQACYAEEAVAHIPIIIIGVPRSLESLSKMLNVVGGRIIEKPFTLKKMAEVLNTALAHYEQTSAVRQSQHALASRFASLTEREREVGMLLGSGLSNQDIAEVLGITVRTVKAHRAKVMEKVDAVSIADYLLKLQRYMSRGRE